MNKDNYLIFEALNNNRQNIQLEKNLKMLINNALKNVFAVIETIEGIDSLPYSGDVDALTVNLDEEVGRLMDILDAKMPKTANSENAESPINAQSSSQQPQAAPQQQSNGMRNIEDVANYISKRMQELSKGGKAPSATGYLMGLKDVYNFIYGNQASGIKIS